MLVHQLVVACGLLRPQPDAAQVQVVRPAPATKEALLAFHNEDYIGMLMHNLIISGAIN